MAEPSPIRIAIVGGGIAGLGLAVGLLHHASGPNPRLKITVYEGAPGLSEVGAGISMGPNSIEAVEMLSHKLRRGLESRGMSVAGPEADDFLHIRYGAAGELDGATVCTISGEGQSNVHRRHVVEEMSKLLPPGLVQYNHKVVRLRNAADEVAIEFANGGVETADFVIGCDGIHGATRRAVLGEDSLQATPTFSGIYVYRKLVPMAEMEAAIGVDVAHATNKFVGPTSWIMAYPVDGGRLVSLGAAKVSDKPWKHHSWTAEIEEGAVDRDYPAENWGKAVQAMFPFMRTGKLWALFDFPETDIFYNNRVCIIGDSAHAAPPSQGSGAAMALEDALVLSRLLQKAHSQDDVRAAFVGFDAVRRPRTARQTETAGQAARVVTFSEEGVGSDIGKIREQMEHRWDWIWHIDLQEHIREAEQAALEARGQVENQGGSISV